MEKIPADHGRSEEDAGCLDRGYVEMAMMLMKKVVEEEIMLFV